MDLGCYVAEDPDLGFLKLLAESRVGPITWLEPSLQLHCRDVDPAVLRVP